MTPERWQQIEGLFQAALICGPVERASLLGRVCDGDQSLRTEVEHMLKAHDLSGEFLESPALEVAARSIAVNHAQSVTGRVLGHYRIERLVGSGGMGEVYLATDTRVNRKVALKLLPDYFVNDPQRVLRFEQEARAVLALNHPNIVTIYEVDHAGPAHFIATEFIEGDTLREHLSRGQITVAEALDVATQVGSALSAAHRVGIVHRDIKPENIMLRPDGYVKVLDFGIAKLNEPDIATSDTVAEENRMTSTSPGSLMGTARYVSPEQASGLEVDARTDIWSLGVVLYEMLAGRVPFDGDTPGECVAAVLDTAPPSLAVLRPGAPLELQWIISKLLRKSREERYQTVTELSSDLRELKQDLDVRSRLTRSADTKVANGALKPNGHLTWNEYSTGPGGATKRKRFGRTRIAAAAVIVVLLFIAAAKYFPVRNQTINSLAVLPFVNVDGESNTDYLADGVTENLINSLSQLPSMKVIARNSVFRYKVRDPQSGVPDPQKVAHELGVQAVLIGRVIQHGDDLFVSAELVSADDNSHIWGAQYNRKLSAVFAVQEQIARDISQELGVKLGSSKQELPHRNPENLKAFEYYMQGRSFVHRRTREDLTMAGSYYQKAIEADQNYALAYAGLAEVYTNLGVRGYIPPVDGRRKSEEAARKALALDENLAEAHVMMGVYYVGYGPYQFAEGDRELRRAIEFKPSLAIAHLYLALSFLRQNRLDEGLNEMLKARELDPFSAIIARQVSLYYLLKRDYSRALQLLKQASEMGPPFTASNEIGIYVQNKLYDEALAALDQQDRERKEDPILIYSRGMVYAAQGRKADALKIARELERLSSNSSQALWIAKIYSALNEKDQAFSWLERGLATGALGTFFTSDPTWDNLRGDARFPGLVREMGIPQS